MFTEGFDRVGEGRNITPEELEAKLDEAPAPVARLVRAIRANHEAVTDVLDIAGKSEDIKLMLAGMGLMVAEGELNDAIGDFLNFLLDHAEGAISSLTGDAVA